MCVYYIKMEEVGELVAEVVEVQVQVVEVWNGRKSSSGDSGSKHFLPISTKQFTTTTTATTYVKEEET